MSHLLISEIKVTRPGVEETGLCIWLFLLYIALVLMCGYMTYDYVTQPIEPVELNQSQAWTAPVGRDFSEPWILKDGK